MVFSTGVHVHGGMLRIHDKGSASLLARWKRKCGQHPQETGSVHTGVLRPAQGNTKVSILVESA